MADFVTPSLLPPPLRRDLNIRALESLSARVSDLDLSPIVVYDFDNVPSSALVHLAEQFNVLGDAGWDFIGNGTTAIEDSKRRALLKEAVALHRIKGTPYAVKRALQLIGVNATLTEWWQNTPQDAPYTFKITATVTDQPAGAPAIDAARTQQIARVVKFWKNARSQFGLSIGVGVSTKLSVANVFSGTQILCSSGVLEPVSANSSMTTRVGNVFSATNIISSNGSLLS